MKGLITMKRYRHSPEQVVRKLREGERLLNDGKDLTEVLRHLEISEATWNRWRNQYGGMKATEARRLRELEVENARLKKSWPRPSWTRRCSRSLAEDAPIDQVGAERAA
jgi:putative transposase